MNENHFNRADELAGVSEAELYSLAFEEIEGRSFRKGEGDDGEHRRRVDHWMADHKAKLHSLLCQERLRVLLDPPQTHKEKVLIVAAVADCISGAIVGLSPLTASALVVNYGIRRLCAE